MPPPANAVKPVEFKGAQLGVMNALLAEADPPRLADALHKMLGGMPDFFNDEPAVLDFGPLLGSGAFPARVDWTGLLSLLRRYRLQPVGVRNVPDEQRDAIRRAGLALLGEQALVTGAPAAMPAPQPAPKPVAAPAPTPAPAVPDAIPAGTMVVDRPLRSGQQVYARGGDLVLLAGISNGAEVIADGSIHCYGPLRGRALAGARGDNRARIFSTDFGPELVSIAGVYRTFDQGIPENVAGRPAQVRLIGQGDQQTLHSEPLAIG